METAKTLDSFRLPKKEKFFYGVADMSTNLVWSMTTTWLLYFLTDILIIPVLAAGTLMLITRFIDAGIDPFIGHIVDRTNTKMGKARPFLLWFAIPLGICGCFLFFTPEFSITGKILYAYVLYILFIIFYSLVGVPYNAMMTLMTKNQVDRTQLSRSRLIFAMIGGIMISLLPICIKALGSGGDKLQIERTGYFNFAIILGVFVIAGYLVTFFNTKEHLKDEDENKQRYSFGTALRAIGKNGQFFLITCITIFNTLRITIVQGMAIYYIQNVMGLPDIYMTIMLLTFFVSIIVGLIFGPAYFTKMEYKKGLNIMAVVGIVGSLILLISPVGLIGMIAFCILNGFSHGIGSVACYSMYGDVVEYGEWKTGKRTQGLIFSSFTLAQQISAGIGAFVISLVLSLSGYVAEATTQSSQAINGIMIAFLSLPILLNVLRIVLLHFYLINKKNYHQIVTELGERHTAVKDA